MARILHRFTIDSSVRFFTASGASIFEKKVRISERYFGSEHSERGVRRIVRAFSSSFFGMGKVFMATPEKALSERGFKPFVQVHARTPVCATPVCEVSDKEAHWVNFPAVPSPGGADSLEAHPPKASTGIRRKARRFIVLWIKGFIATFRFSFRQPTT
jgi:hypothetical protein